MLARACRSRRCRHPLSRSENCWPALWRHRRSACRSTMSWRSSRYPGSSPGAGPLLVRDIAARVIRHTRLPTRPQTLCYKGFIQIPRTSVIELQAWGGTRHFFCSSILVPGPGLAGTGGPSSFESRPVEPRQRSPPQFRRHVIGPAAQHEPYCLLQPSAVGLRRPASAAPDDALRAAATRGGFRRARLDGRGRAAPRPADLRSQRRRGGDAAHVGPAVGR